MTSSPETPATKTRWYRNVGLLFGLLVLGGLCAWFWGAVENAREAARSSHCLGNMCQLRTALFSYHEMEGRFPPAHATDSDGEPLSSWRVLVSQYADQYEFFKAYNLQAAWDDETNYELAQNESSTFLWACPSGPDFHDPRDADYDPASPCYTNYVAITGPGTIFPGGDDSVSLDDITDGPENTILLVEIADSEIHWSEPRDLHIDQMSFTINDPAKPSISSPHQLGPGVVFADGYYCRIAKSMPPETLKALMTISGGENVSRKKLSQQGHLRR